MSNSLGRIRLFSTTAKCLAKKKPNGKGSDLADRPKYFGRPSNNLTSGIVGLANVGKSTFFQAITKSTLGNPANYPFATIDPEEARVMVASPKLDHLQKLYGSGKQVPSYLTIFDIAGLTRNASDGEGLGNKFLADIRAVDGIFQVVRGFRDDEITHIEGSVDPVRDLTIVSDELILKDMEFCENGLEKLKKKMKSSSGAKEVVLENKTLQKAEELLSSGKRIISGEWTNEEIAILNQYTFLTAKPVVYLLNVNESDYACQTNEFYEDVKGWIEENSPDDELLIFSADFETKYNELSEDAEALEMYCDEIGATSSLSLIADKMREVLHLISFYTCGPLEAHQWTIREGSTAPEAASVIHTDLKDHFISAQVLKYVDLDKESGPLNEAKLRAAGKVYKEGKKYIVEDGDVLVIKAVGAKAR